jgi:type II secretory pathway component PulC
MFSNRKTKVYLLCIVCAGLGVYAAKLLFDYLTQIQNIKDAGLKPQSVSVKAEAVPACVPPVNDVKKEHPQAKKLARPALVLNGIMFSPGRSYALINNRIVKEGDTIEGVTVKQISADSVEMQDGQAQFKISPNIKSF